MTAPRQVFDILAVGQFGRLQYEAVLLAASLRQSDPGFPGRLWIAEPEPGPLWPADPRMAAGPRAALEALGAEVLPFASRDFGARYPQGNKIEALAALPDRPFLFLDTDTLITGSFADVAFDFDRPSASMRREATWPKLRPGRPGPAAIWKALHERFGLDFAASLDPAWPEGHWRRHLYFNAGWFFHRSPGAFGRRYRDIAVSIRDDPPPELAGQPLDPWLDQVALPLVIHALGGGRPDAGLAGMDGAVTCHWRTLPLLYARESDQAVAVLEAVCARPEVRAALAGYAPAARMVDRGGGRQARALFDRERLPATEQEIRQRLKRAGLWLR
jgi:hypothetical protein